MIRSAVRLSASSKRNSSRKNIPFSAFPVHNIMTIDELESRTGLDLLPELPSYLQRPLEADLPTRLWPVRFIDIFRLIWMRFF